MQIFVTILEETVDAAVEAIRALTLDHDGIEVRTERFAGAGLTPLRNATSKPIILTHRGMAIDRETIVRGVDCGFEYVDVEWPPRYELPHRDRIVLSHHDYAAVPDIGALVPEMQAVGCAHVKIAATPRSFAENDWLLWDRLRLSGQTGVSVPHQTDGPM
ncbi:MAG TPA: type I 3-dehydroquinate dehydratase, partial [Thermoanaerobaculia bacterium]